MSRIPLVRKDVASPEVAAVYEMLEGAFNKVPNLFATLANHPPALKPMLELFGALYEQSEIEPRLLEFVVLKIAYGYQSDYCLTMHKAFALERGITNEEIYAMEDRANWGRFPANEQALLGYTAQFQADPLGLTDEHHGELAQHFSESQIVNLVALMGLASLFGQMANALQIPVDEFIGAG